MTTPTNRFAALAALLIGASLVLAPMASLAQDAATPAPATDTAAAPAPVDPNTVLATVGDETITEGDLSFAAEDLGQDLGNVPEADRKAFLLTVMIDMKVMAMAAKKDGMDQSDTFKRRLAYLADRALRRDYFAEKVASQVTPEALQTAYDEFVKTFVPTEEVHARHILVASEDDAKAIKAELDGGASFEDLAKTKSIDPSGASNGGDLGFFSKGQMVKPFEDAAFAMEVGQISDPIQSQFGWHIIKVEEKRESAPPTMDQVGQQLQQQILFKGFDDTVAVLKKDIAVTIPDAALAAEVAKQGDAGAQ